MRFLVLMIPGAYSTELGERMLEGKNGHRTDPSLTPATEEMAKMGKFNDELAKAGALLSVDGLLPLKAGTRLTFSGGKASVTDGSLIKARDVVGGYWLLQAESKQRVIDLMKHCPAQADDIIEIRQIAEMTDFPVEVQAAARD